MFIRNHSYNYNHLLTTLESILILWITVTTSRYRFCYSEAKNAWDSLTRHPTNPISVPFFTSVCCLCRDSHTHTYTHTSFHHTFVLSVPVWCNSCMDSLCASPRSSSCLFRKLICCWVLSLLLS